MMIFQIYKDANAEWRWRLKAANGKTIADSGEGYKRRSACRAAIRRVGLAFNPVVVEYC